MGRRKQNNRIKMTDFKSFKKACLKELDSTIGFIPGMEIFEEEGLVKATLNDELVASVVPDYQNVVWFTGYIKEQVKDLRINASLNVIRQAIEKHGNKVFAGYSGGKDSKVILHLARQVCPTLVAVHNSHPEEKCDLKTGVVIIKEPKSNFIEYLKYVDVTASIDGTRLAEEGKSVIWDGVEIERADMKNLGMINPRGVFDLEIYYPILHWSDKDVWDYIEEHKLMTMYEAHNYIPSRPYRGAEANPYMQEGKNLK